MLLIVEREITERMDKLVKERVAECLKTYVPQEPQDEVARSNHESPQPQPPPGSQLPHTGLSISLRNPPSAPQGPSTPTLSHTIASPIHPPHPSAITHSSNSLRLTSPPPTSSTPSITSANQDVGSRTSVPRTAAKITIRKADGTEVSLENLTKNTPTPPTPAISSPQSVVLRQGSPGTPNRRPTSIRMETEDQHKSRLAEQEQNDRLMAEAADKEEKGKEKAESECKAKVAEEICTVEGAARLEKKEKKRRRKQEERLRKEAEALLELQRLKEEEGQRLKLEQEEGRMLKVKQEEEKALQLAQEKAKEEKERKEKEEQEEQERLSKLAEETRFRLEEEVAAKAKAEAISEPEPKEKEEAELGAHKGDGKQDAQLEDGKTSSINSPRSDRRRPGPLDLTSAMRSASPVVALAAARFIDDIATVSYPEGVQHPHPDLNQDVKNGKFRYH